MMTSQEAVVLRIQELCQQKGLTYYNLAYEYPLRDESYDYHPK